MVSNVLYEILLTKQPLKIKMENKRKVIKIDEESLEFDDGSTLYSNHDSDCCETHYLCLKDLTLADFDKLEFDLSNDNFFERIEDYGIALKPIHGHPVRIPGYGYNNGYYSSQLDLILTNPFTGIHKTFDITACQVITD